MKILVSCVHFAVSSGRYITRALRKLGHDVRSIGPGPGHHIWGMTVNPRWAWEPDVPVGGDGGWYLDPAWVPDLVVTADSAWTIKPIWDCPHVCWACDNHVRDYRYDGLPFDALFVAHTWGLRKPGEPGVYWLPPAYEPEDHYDEGQERDLDVALVGVLYDERIKLVQALAEAGLNVLAGTGALYDDYRATYCRAKISLVVPILRDVPHRLLETAAMGCCVVAAPMTDARRMGFEPWRDYVPFDNAEDCVRRVQALVAGDSWREYAAQGQIAAKPHTWTARAEEMLRVCREQGLISKEPVSP